jgi:ABC-2 type transport system ATP-binding protein
VGAVIEVEGLRKSYGAVEAVRDIDLRVSEGEVLAMLGPNGAGKTTTVEILEGYRARDAGHVSVLGMDPWTAGAELRRRVGIVLQSCGFDPYLTVAEILRMYAGFYPAPRKVDEVVALVGLEEKAGNRVRSLSGGQQRRLDVGLALIGDPELLFLDEPTTGFDPSARRHAWAIVRDLCSLGKTVLLTTHYMDEAQALADRIVVIRDGRIVAEGTPDQIGGRSSGTVTIRFAIDDGGIALPEGFDAGQRDGEAIVVRTTDPVPVLHRLTSWSLEHGVEIRNLSVTPPSLEDVYLELTT